ncbi:MAG: imidazole glycerol phosphate synthase subunit HisH [Minisyncoccota bacterium]
MTLRVAVIDYGMGNIGSISKMLRHVGAEPVVTADPALLRAADKLVLPGVGHFDRAMQNLAAVGLVDELKGLVAEGKPMLGICLGMQLMCASSDEGTLPGLGLLDARVRRFEFPNDRSMKVPHMGWTDVEVAPRATALFAGLEEEARFYFVHSFYVECANDEDVLGRSRYGHPFVSAFARGTVQGVQFHPEKSHRYGIQLFRNFVSDRP